MSPAAAASAVPTRSQVQSWDTTALDDAAPRWRGAATAAETAFEQHRQNIAAPGGTEWEGDAKDAALDRVAVDLGVARRQGDVQRAAADVAARGSADIRLLGVPYSTPSPRPRPTTSQSVRTSR